MSEQKPEYLKDALEMIGMDLEAPKQIIQEVSGFTPLFDVVIQKYKDETRAAVHGAMWRFCQMQDGVCKASLNTIAELIGVDVSTVSRHAEVLCDDGFFIDLTPDLRNRPHVYADTGKVVMKSKLTAGFAQSKATVAQSKATVAESRMSKVLKKDFEEKGDKSPNLSIENQIFLGFDEVTIPDNTQALRKDAANLIAMTFGAKAPQAFDLVMAFQNERGITFTESDIKGQRKAVKALLEKNVQPNHVQQAVSKLLAGKMTISDLFGIVKTAIDLAVTPVLIESRAEYQPFPFVGDK